MRICDDLTCGEAGGAFSGLLEKSPCRARFRDREPEPRQMNRSDFRQNTSRCPIDVGRLFFVEPDILAQRTSAIVRAACGDAVHAMAALEQYRAGDH
jgi:hypothetical protein